VVDRVFRAGRGGGKCFLCRYITPPPHLTVRQRDSTLVRTHGDQITLYFSARGITKVRAGGVEGGEGFGRGELIDKN